MNKDVCGIFELGDIVKDGKDSAWGETKFEIIGFHGNSYCPLLQVVIHGKPKDKLSNQCSLDARSARLMYSDYRPFRNLNMVELVTLIKAGDKQAKRELKIRINNKK